nr:SDR family NAD(P)-dependent oxidoreductase [Pseudomonas mendocina]
MSVLDLFKLDGRVALVTGASRGIGCAIARGLSEAGATVYGISRSGETEAQEGVFQYRQCDIQDKESFSRLLAELVETHGRLDILVNAAGITMPDQMEADPLATFQRTLDLNLTAAFACSYLALPYMLSGGYGSIINVTSIGAALGFPGNPGYVASKGGLAAMTRALARDYGARGIRVNNIVPGSCAYRNDARQLFEPRTSCRTGRAYDAGSLGLGWGIVRRCCFPGFTGKQLYDWR